MDDLYCPPCRLVLYGQAGGWIPPEHCPRCARHARQIELLARRSNAARRPLNLASRVRAPTSTTATATSGPGA